MTAGWRPLSATSSSCWFVLVLQLEEEEGVRCRWQETQHTVPRGQGSSWCDYGSDRKPLT